MPTVVAESLLDSDGRPRRLKFEATRASLFVELLGLSLDGEDRQVTCQRSLSNVDVRDHAGSLVYFDSEALLSLIEPLSGCVVLTRPGLAQRVPEGNSVLTTPGSPKEAFYAIHQWMAQHDRYERLEGRIASDSQISAHSIIGPNVVVGSGAVIGAGVVIEGNTYVGPGVTIKANATVGGDGFETAVADGRKILVKHCGGVWLQEGVAIGSSTCIDKGLLGDWTFLGADTKVDNLVHVAHNVRAGRGVCLVACSEVSGSVTIGDGVWLAPCAAVNQLVAIGDHAFIGTGSVVTRDIPAHSLAFGSPCRVAGVVCECREKLKFLAGVAVCGRCGRRYSETSKGIERA